MPAITADGLEPDRFLTSHQVSDLLQVTPNTIIKWINDGRLPGFRTLGGHRRVRAADLRQFLRDHQMPVPKALRHSGKRRLLIVDDDHAQLRSFARLLQDYADSVEVTTVDNGIEALILVGELRPHLVILDVFMPDVDGLEVCKRLKASASTKNIQAIVTSGQMTSELEARALEAGAIAVLEKPIDLGAVLQYLGVSESVVPPRTT